MEKKHGGARFRAGRKPIDPALGRRVKASFTVRQSHKDALRAMEPRTRARALDAGLQIAIDSDIQFNRVLIEYAPQMLELIQHIAIADADQETIEDFASAAANILSRMNASISD